MERAITRDVDAWSGAGSAFEITLALDSGPNPKKRAGVSLSTFLPRLSLEATGAGG